MVGKRSIKTGLIVLILLFFSDGAAARERGWVAILLSDDVAAYQMPVRSFRDSIEAETELFNLKGDIRHDQGLKGRLAEDKPELIFALGAKAAFAAKLWTVNHQDIPVIFAMVLNWRKYGLLDGQTNMAGISSEVNPGTQFFNLSIFVSNINKIGVIYSPDYSREIVEQAKLATEMLGLELIEKHVTSAADFQQVYRKIIYDIDSLWVLSDPVTFTLENMAWLERRCIKDRLVCIGPSRNLTELGLLLSVRPDLTNIGVQAASMAKNILYRKQKPSDIGVMEPLGTSIVINKQTAEQIGIQLSSKAMAIATEIVE